MKLSSTPLQGWLNGESRNGLGLIPTPNLTIFEKPKIYLKPFFCLNKLDALSKMHHPKAQSPSPTITCPGDPLPANIHIKLRVAYRLTSKPRLTSKLRHVKMRSQYKCNVVHCAEIPKCIIQRAASPTLAILVSRGYIQLWRDLYAQLHYHNYVWYITYTKTMS